jgi:hypothetical protein
MDIDPERTTSLNIIQIGTMNVQIEGSGKRPAVPNNQVVIPTLIMRPAEASLVRSAFCQDGALPA